MMYSIDLCKQCIYVCFSCSKLYPPTYIYIGPTLKVKRSEVERMYAKEINKLYDEDNGLLSKSLRTYIHKALFVSMCM